MRVQTEYFINEHMYVTFWLSNVIFKACFRIGWIAFPSTGKRIYRKIHSPLWNSAIVFKLVAFLFNLWRADISPFEILNLFLHEKFMQWIWSTYCARFVVGSYEDLSHSTFYLKVLFRSGKVWSRNINFYKFSSRFPGYFEYWKKERKEERKHWLEMHDPRALYFRYFNLVWSRLLDIIEEAPTKFTLHQHYSAQ